MVNVNSRRSAILWSAVGIAALLMFAVLLANSNTGATTQLRSPVAAQQSYAEALLFGNDPFHLAATNVQCTLDITTTDSEPTGNNSFSTAATIDEYQDQALVSGNPGDVATPAEDYYRLDNASLYYKYTIEALPSKTDNYSLGIIVYDKNQTPVITDTNTFDGGTAEVTFPADNAGPYYFKIYQISDQCTGDTYYIDLTAVAPTGTPSPTNTPTATPEQTAIPTPQPTWVTGFDVYEPNFDFSLATTIASGLDYKANFVPWGGADVDNDFYRIRVKPGLQVTCETKNLDPGVDPRMELYSGGGSQYFVTANDDVSLGDFNSRVSYFSLYEGYIYLLVGQGNRMELRDTVNSDYTVVCQIAVPGTSTPAPEKVVTPVPQPTYTPYPTLPPATITPVPTTRSLTFRIVQTPAPATTTPDPTGYRTFQVRAYFDNNLDGVPGAGEGITGIFVMVLSSDGNTELAQGYTDGQGQISFSVSTTGTVRVVIPLLGVDQMVQATKPEVVIRVVPPELPNTLP